MEIERYIEKIKNERESIIVFLLLAVLVPTIADITGIARGSSFITSMYHGTFGMLSQYLLYIAMIAMIIVFGVGPDIGLDKSDTYCNIATLFGMFIYYGLYLVLSIILVRLKNRIIDYRKKL